MEKAKVVTAGAVSVVVFFLGHIDFMVTALLALCCVDFVSGITRAWFDRDVNSREMFRGGVKKVGIFLIIAVANLTDRALSLDGLLRSIAIGYYAANEGLSVLENWGRMGLPLPAKLRDVLKQIRDESDKGARV